MALSIDSFLLVFRVIFLTLKWENEMAKTKPKNESDTDVDDSNVLYVFKTIKDANEYLTEVLNLSALGNNREEVEKNNAILDDNNEHLAVAIRKVLTSLTVASREPLRKIYQELFDRRGDTTLTDAEREKSRRELAVLKRATRTATDSDAFDRKLWTFDYSITCNTIKNNYVAKFEKIPHNPTEESEAESEDVKTDFDVAYEYLIFRINNEDFAVWSLVVQSRLELEKQGYNADDIEFVGVIGKKPAFFKLKDVA